MISSVLMMCVMNQDWSNFFRDKEGSPYACAIKLTLYIFSLQLHY
jgi:hypothetical protein